MQAAIDLYVQMATLAIPFGFAFCIGNVIVNTFFRMAFGGKVEIGL